MTSIINNSNANSALVNTLNASDSKVNPNIYSTKKIYPPAATCYVRTDKASGTVGPGNSIIFNLLKYGVAQQILLCYTKVGNSTMALDAGDIFNVIDRVELLSSSKVIAQLTKYDLLAQFSNLDASQYIMVGEYAVKARSAGASQKYVIPLVFGFMKDVNTNLNLQFNEPMSIRVKFGSQLEKSSAGTPTANNAIQDVYLRMRYKAYNESDFAEIVAENYNQPELNIMSSGFYDESAGTLTVKATAGGAVTATRTIQVPLKNTDCVNDFYVFVRQVDNDGQGGQNTTSAPEKLTNLKFTASGQEIINLTGEELSYTRLAMNGFSVQPLLEAAGTEWVTNVYKIQTGLWEYSGGGTQSNTLSLRELNNPIVEAEFSGASDTTNDKNYEIVVVEDCVKIFSTTSSNGRVQIALSN
jgi:hypothetical protein